MSPSPPRTDPNARREALVIAAMTALGGLLRIWSIGRLGLVHFDEGIYAMAGTWVASPRGLDPSVISYAPPGFPFLVGLAYSLLGVSDTTAILVSIVAGTLTISVAGWLAHRTFGSGAGAAASAFAALSGAHIAFSRMALTDVSFALAWLIAIGQGQRFLERPGPWRAVTLGFSVGVAQLFKYNGWIAGAVVAAAAMIGPLLGPDLRDGGRQRAIWAWGLLAAAIAAVVYWPWFRFVEAHGGYAALLAHQRGYMGGISSWRRHLLSLFLQDDALSGGASWLAAVAFVAALGMLVTVGRQADVRGARTRIGLALLGFTALCAYPGSEWYGALFWLSVLNPLAARLVETRAHHFLVIAWLILAVMTPFYHPYARLLMPLHALGWILMGGAFATMLRILDRVSRKSGRTILGIPKPWAGFAMACVVVPVVFLATGFDYRREARLSALLEPSDSLRVACRTIAAELPDGLGRLRLYARPPVTFYLSGRVPVAPLSTIDDLFAAGDPGAWALLDAAMIRQEGGFRRPTTAPSRGWELVREVPTILNLPTALDVDPSAGSVDRTAPSCSLLLFRPKSQGAPR